MIRPTLIAGWCPLSIIDCPSCDRPMLRRGPAVLGSLVLCEGCGKALELRNVAGDRWLWAVVEEVAA